MIACILCGGVGEVMLVTAGLGWIIAWFKKRHNKRKCKCCQEHEQDLPVQNNHQHSEDTVK